MSTFVDNRTQPLQSTLVDISIERVKIGGKVIEFVSSYSHLGHVVTDSLDDGPDISKRQGDFIGQANSVRCDFRQLPSIVKYRLFSSYCTSFYGSELWHLSNDVSQFWHYVEEKCEENLEFT